MNILPRLLQADIHVAVRSRSSCRRVSIWSKFWKGQESSGRKNDFELVFQDQPSRPVGLTPARHIQEWTQKHMPTCGRDWQTTSLHDAGIKSKLLLSCEGTFDQRVPDNQLGSILTVKDLIKFFEQPQSTHDPYTIFPNIDQLRSKGKLPTNLSFPKVTSEPKPVPKRTRIPFQNFDSPKHANFLTKQEKEARKRKRRHLTAWK